MLLDKQLMFSEAQALTSTGNTLSTNTIDLGLTGSPAIGGTILYDIGRGSPVLIIAQVVTTFTSGGAGTLAVQFVQADNAALSTNLEVLQATDAIALATLTAGYTFRLSAVPSGVSKRYIGLRYVIGTAAMTAGAVTAGLALDRTSNPTTYA